MFEGVDDTHISTGNDNLDMVVNGMKKLLPVFDDISEVIADKIEDFVDDIIDLF
ncbi:MAG: hypothetical protein IKY22_02135 [Bacteroidales bacterium]|nr:hypothetical protein [Bacteroidales bacterium]